jgi:hypothetical protein
MFELGARNMREVQVLTPKTTKEAAFFVTK